IRDFRQYDERETLEPAFNYKMTEMQAAMGLCQLERLGSFLARRRAIAARYADAIRKAGLVPPSVTDGREHGYFRFVVRLPKPMVDEVMARARAMGVACRRPIFRPIHRYFRMEGYPESD